MSFSMDDQDKQAFVAMMRTMGLHYSVDVTKEQMAHWWHQLRDLPMADVARAADALMKSGERFMPNPGVLRAQLKGNPKQNAKLAWQQVVALAGRYGADGQYHGADNRPKFTDPALNRAIDTIGWSTICLTSHDQQQWVQKRFEEAYEAVLSDPLPLPTPALEGRAAAKIESLAARLRVGYE